MHAQALNWITEQVAQIGTPQYVIELGSRNINGGVRNLFSGCTYVGVDIADGPGVDLVADAREWRPRRLVDLVACFEVLEHCEHPYRLIDAAYEMLLPHGVLLLTCATNPRLPHSGHDGGWLRDGEYYRNVTVEELREPLERFADYGIWEFEERGDLYLVAKKGD